MKNRRSSFHMGDEFNGNGEKVYLHATEYKNYSPLSQENVRLTPNFEFCMQKMLGAVPMLINSTNKKEYIVLKALGGIVHIEQVIVKKNMDTGEYFTNYRLKKIRLTNGSYLYKKARK